ncbi:MAG: hypothetical protein ACJAZT_002121 [Gammaproteobacteria bacterium]|jgi:hypothetical protein
MGLITLLNPNISPVIFQKRSHAFKQQKNQPRHLLPFVGHHPLNMPKGLAYQLINYCELVYIFIKPQYTTL